MRMTSFIRVTFLAFSILTSGYAQTNTALIPVKIVASRTLSAAPFYIALEENFFKDEGLQVEMVEFTQSRVAFPALATGETDVQVSGVTPGFFNSVVRGAQVKLVAGVHTSDASECSGFAICANEKLLQSGRLKTAKDLVGLRIAADRSTWAPYLFDVLLRKEGLTLDDIDRIDAPIPTRAEGMRNGSFDVGILPEPQLTQALQGGGIQIWKQSYEILPVVQSTGIIFGPNLLQKNRETGKKFLKAYLRGLQQYRQGKTPRNIELLAKVTELTPEFLKAACWSPAEPNGEVKLEYFLGYQTWCAEQKLVDKEMPADKLWDGSFLKAAQDELNNPKR